MVALTGVMGKYSAGDQAGQEAPRWLPGTLTGTVEGWAQLDPLFLQAELTVFFTFQLRTCITSLMLHSIGQHSLRPAQIQREQK